jgi:hypothetical protein
VNLKWRAGRTEGFCHGCGDAYDATVFRDAGFFWTPTQGSDDPSRVGQQGTVATLGCRTSASQYPEPASGFCAEEGRDKVVDKVCDKVCDEASFGGFLSGERWLASTWELAACR